MAKVADINAKLRPFHLASGLLIGAFLLAHLANHAAMIGGAEVHISIMETMRPLYRNLLIESLLMLALAFQVTSGLTMIWRRRRESKTTLAKVQIWSGVVLALFIANHVGAIWVGRLVLQLDTNYHFAAAGFHAGLVGFFAPYYFAGVSAAFIHVACALRWRTKSNIVPVFIGVIGIVLGAIFVTVMALDDAIPVPYLETYR